MFKLRVQKNSEASTSTNCREWKSWRLSMKELSPSHNMLCLLISIDPLTSWSPLLSSAEINEEECKKSVCECSCFVLLEMSTVSVVWSLSDKNIQASSIKGVVLHLDWLSLINLGSRQNKNLIFNLIFMFFFLSPKPDFNCHNPSPKSEFKVQFQSPSQV